MLLAEAERQCLILAFSPQGYLVVACDKMIYFNLLHFSLSFLQGGVLMAHSYPHNNSVRLKE